MNWVEFGFRAVLIGAGATIVMDLWTMLLRRGFGVASLDYALVGRWFGHLSKGRVRHPSIGKAAPVHGERIIGWAAHYAIGVVFAALLLVLWGLDWAYRPTILPALAVGIGAIVAPFFIMQPAMGFGIAAAKTPKPAVSRLRSLATHTVFGIGLYAAAVMTALILPGARL